MAAIVRPSYNTSSVTYRLLGDNSSVSTVFAALVANCSVATNGDSIYVHPFIAQVRGVLIDKKGLWGEDL